VHYRGPMRRTLPLAVAGALSLAAGACGSSPATPSPAHGVGALAGRSATQVLAAARAAANSAGTAHLVLTLASGGQTQVITGDASTTEGQETITIGSNHVQVVLVGGAAYVQGNAGGLTTTLGFSATVAKQFAGRWIEVKSTDGPYQSIEQSVTLDSTLAQLVPTGKLSLTAPVVFAGRQTIGVRGGLPGTAPSGVTGSTTLYVATSKPTLPVHYSGVARKASETVTDTGTFSKWGEPVTLAAPTGTVAYSSLPTK